MTVQPGLCQTWSEPQIVGFLTHRHRFSYFSGGIPIGIVGQYLDTVQSAKMILEDASVSPYKRYTSVSNLKNVWVLSNV